MRILDFKIKGKGFSNQTLKPDYSLNDRLFYRVSIPIDLIKKMKKIDYNGYDEILPGEIFCLVDRKDKTTFDNNIFTIEDISNCYINTRGIDLNYYENITFHIKDGIKVYDNFIEVNFFRFREEEKIENNKIVIV